MPDAHVLNVVLQADGQVRPLPLHGVVAVLEGVAATLGRLDGVEPDDGVPVDEDGEDGAGPHSGPVAETIELA